MLSEQKCPSQIEPHCCRISTITNEAKYTSPRKKIGRYENSTDFLAARGRPTCQQRRLRHLARTWLSNWPRKCVWVEWKVTGGRGPPRCGHELEGGVSRAGEPGRGEGATPRAAECGRSHEPGNCEAVPRPTSDVCREKGDWAVPGGVWRHRRWYSEDCTELQGVRENLTRYGEERGVQKGMFVSSTN